MAFSHVSYVATPGQDTFALTFEYLKQSHVHVYIDEVETVAFSILGTDVVLDTPAAGGEVVRLQRLTPNTVAGFLTDYQDGQTPRASDHDTNRVQLLYIIQEALDGVTEVEGLIGTGAALPPAEGVSDFIVSDGAGDAWDVKSLAQTKTILGIGGETLPAAEGVGDFLVSDAAGEDGWDVKSTALTKTVLGIDQTLAQPTAVSDFLVADAAGDGGWDVKTLAETKTILGVQETLEVPEAQYDFLVSDAAGTGQWDVKSLAETKTILGINGTLGAGYVTLAWQGPTNTAAENVDIDDGFLHPVPGVNALDDAIYFSAPVPPDFDVTAAFTLNFLVHVNAAPSDGDFDLEIWRLLSGTVNNGAASAADVAETLSVTAAGTVQHETAFFQVAVTPGSALAGAKALWLRVTKAASFTGDFYFPNVWITY